MIHHEGDKGHEGYSFMSIVKNSVAIALETSRKKTLMHLREQASCLHGKKYILFGLP